MAHQQGYIRFFYIDRITMDMITSLKIKTSAFLELERDFSIEIFIDIKSQDRFYSIQNK